MAPPSARNAILKWFRNHPKTYCPVVGQAVCTHRGCDNARLRADARCNFDLKKTMADRAAAGADFRPVLFDLRESDDRRRFILNFGFDKATIADLKAMIPSPERGFLPASREWWVDKKHYGLLATMFANFGEFHSVLLARQRASGPSPGRG